MTRGRVAGVAFAACVALVSACGDDDDEPVAEPTAATGPGAPVPNEPGAIVPFRAATVGDCWNQTQTGDGTYEAVDCADWHDYEIHAVVPVGDDLVAGSGGYPGERALSEAAQRLCEREFADYVGRGYEESLVLTQPIPPSEEEWEAGSRDVVCSLFDPAGRTMGSLYRSFQ